MPPAAFLLGAVDDGSYKALLAIHILCAVAWVGGGLMLTLQGERARRADDDREMVKVAAQAEFFATRMFVPLSIVLLGVGIGMVQVGHIGFDHPFVMVGLSGWTLSFLLGAGFLGPQSAKVRALAVAADGAVTVDVPAQALARINRIVLVARLDLLILALVIVNMVVKPGGGV